MSHYELYIEGGVMKYKRLLFLSTVIIVLFLASVSFAAIPIDVTVGKETILNLKEPSKRVSIADPKVAELIVISPSEVVINGKKPGVTSLIIWDMEGKATFFDVIVYLESPVELQRKRIAFLEEKIKSIAPDADVKAEFAGDTIVLNGTAKNRQMVDKIEKITLLHSSKGCKGISRSSSLPRTSEESKSEAKEMRLIDRGWGVLSVTQGATPEGGPEVTGTGSSSTLTPTTEEQAVQQAEKPSGALCVLNLITIPEAEQIILEVIVAQIRKTKLQQLGISFVAKGIQDNAEVTFPGLFTSPSGSVGGGPGLDVRPGIGSFDLGALAPQIGFAHFPSGIAFVLRALQEKGYGKILAEPNMVVRSGERGNFHVGTRVPIQTVYGIGTAATPSITYEEVGIRLNFAPEVLETGAIRLTIDPAEVSSIIRYVQFLGAIAPEIDTRTVKTSVDLREGESLILAGLLSEEMRKSINKMPVLGDIPILGALFRSTDDELEQNELAFFITPRLVKPIAPGVRPELPTDKGMTPDEEKEFEWIPMPRAASR
jgi:pilus assembly protein CpaC